MGKEHSRLVVPNDLSYLPAIRAYVGAVAAKVGFSDKETGRLQLAVDEACTHVIETSFEPGEETIVSVAAEESDVGLRIVIADQGMPFNPASVIDYDPAAGLDRELGGMGFYLMKRMMDEVRFISKGPEGKELHLVKYLETGSITAYLSEEELQPYEMKVQPAPPGSYEFRLMQPTQPEAIEVSKCVYKTYGYTYPGEHVYYPDRLVEMNRSGELVSVVVVTDAGEVAGHCAISSDTPGSAIRELGQAAVDPAHRGRRLLTRLLSFAIEEARRMGLAGLFGEPVTNHPFSQKASYGLGFRDTALLLGYIPQSVLFKKIGDEALAQRMTLLLNFMLVGDCGRSRIYTPYHHRTMLAKIYDSLGLRRQLALPSEDALAQCGEQSELSTLVMSAIDAARIEIKRPGRYVTTEVEIKLNELARKGMACIHLDLPLTDPSAALLCSHFEALGFVLAGILPKADGNDTLRLQYLNDVSIDFDQIIVDSEIGNALFEYIRSQY
jgi:serine/threonine-protein kinase RsbW